MNREKIIKELAQQWTDAIELDDLLNFFKEKQIEYLEQLSDKELKRIYKENKGK